MQSLKKLPILALALLPLTGCVVYPNRPPPPYAQAYWVPGHFVPWGVWHRGHWR